ncbi:hypothetical protein ACI01nite_11200 [Acetobacter cibinongensis]|uniref:Secreted protein n=1 Tax=Acetobacter cibinongensis TaxID=146475 RepID=A0A0D6N5K0_9PROT|nr:hypothetical protein [Acetobacter cibinongensis]GAN60985.1 hypothetical protein Abci_017_169 [Acetobacter cibinongensis]GBQ13058.1 hypothetical protein AA0482_0463 [Acetobacter cibinongensis NRIC 0482]GEL58518.1 hypothetical protein ACI01nite_11200 [Acetobacter cibinongensis]
MSRITALSALPALLVALLCVPLSAHAEGGDEVRSKVPNMQLQKELAVLQFQPEAASEACIESLKELHKTQALLEEEQKHTNDQDLAIAQDVLESDFENSIEMCAPDVHKLCETQNPDVKLVKACENVGSLPDTTASAQ